MLCGKIPYERLCKFLGRSQLDQGGDGSRGEVKKAQQSSLADNI
jgi:hypothetical protein